MNKRKKTTITVLFEHITTNKTVIPSKGLKEVAFDNEGLISKFCKHLLYLKLHPNYNLMEFYFEGDLGSGKLSYKKPVRNQKHLKND
jgi:hypothetical protein